MSGLWSGAPIQASFGAHMSETQGPAAGVAAEKIDVAGTPTALRRAGDGPPLLFLHGAGFTGTWLRFHEALSRAPTSSRPSTSASAARRCRTWMRSMDDMLVHYDDLVRTMGVERFDPSATRSAGGWPRASRCSGPSACGRSRSSSRGLRLPGTETPPDLFLMDPDQLADHLFEDRTNIDEVFAPAGGRRPDRRRHADVRADVRRRAAAVEPASRPLAAAAPAPDHMPNAA